MAAKSKPTAAIFASGTGTNAENILRFAAENSGKISIPLLICNKEGAGVLERAKNFNVACEVVPVLREGFPDFKSARIAQEKKVLEICAKHNIEWALLAGYMQIISPAFLDYFSDAALGINRVVNIHPSLLPAFPGKDSYTDAWNAGVETSGVTMHFVIEEVDAGPVIARKSFKRLPGDTLDTFRARGMALEYEAYREFLEQLTNTEGKWARSA